MSYDSWLERPYQQAAEGQVAYEDWCEANELDPTDLASNYAYADYIADGEEAWAERRLEDRG